MISAKTQEGILSNLTPEFRLLSASGWLPAKEYVPWQRDRLAGILHDYPINWMVFLSLAKIHGIHPIVAANLAHSDVSLIPCEVFEQLKQWSTITALSSLRRAHEFLRISRMCADKGLTIIPLKGEILSVQLYNSFGMRQTSDLDILVKPDDLESVQQLLDADGYLCSLHGTTLTARQKRYVRDNLYHLEFFRADKGETIELHWHLGSLWQPEQMSLVWTRTMREMVAGTAITTLDSHVRLLFLCDHGARHRFCCLKWLSDIARSISLLQDDEWPDLLTLADQLDLRRTFALVLKLLEWVYAFPLPTAAREVVANDRYSENLAKTIYKLILLSTDPTVSVARRLGGVTCSWQVLRLRSSVPVGRTLRSAMISAADFHKFPLPDWLFWLYYPLRPFSWLKKYYCKS